MRMPLLVEPDDACSPAEHLLWRKICETCPTMIRCCRAGHWSPATDDARAAAAQG